MEMNETLRKKIEQAAIDGSKHYRPNISKYSQGKQVGYVRGFNAGAEFALSHQWISVEDALPERSVMVIVKDKYGNYDTAYLSKKGYWIANDGKEIIVSFWMPIPKFEQQSKM